MVTPSREAAQMPASTTSKRRLDREAQAALLRVRTRPECPKGNLRELTWDRKPDCGIAIQQKALTWDTSRPAHRPKDWAELASCGLAHPPPETGRQGQPEPEGGDHSPREASSTKLQAGFIANQDFLGFWMVDIRREGRSQRSAPQKRHKAHLRRCADCTPRKLSGMDRGGVSRSDCTPQAPGHLSCSDLRRAQNAGPTESAPLWSTPVPEPERLRPGKCIQPRASLRQFPAEQPRA